MGKSETRTEINMTVMFTVNASLIELFHFAVTRQRALEKALRLRAEQSMASTLKDTSEIPVS